jgi:hypothetical protein
MYSQKKMKEYKYWTEIDDDYITYRALFLYVCVRLVYAHRENSSKPSSPAKLHNDLRRNQWLFLLVGTV